MDGETRMQRAEGPRPQPHSRTFGKRFPAGRRVACVPVTSVRRVGPGGWSGPVVWRALFCRGSGRWGGGVVSREGGVLCCCRPVPAFC